MCLIIISKVIKKQVFSLSLENTILQTLKKGGGGRGGLSNWTPAFLRLKNTTGVGTSQFGKKYDLVNSKSELHKLDIDKLTELNADI